MENSCYSEFSSPVGKLLIVSSARGLLRLEFADRISPCGSGRLTRVETGESPVSTQEPAMSGQLRTADACRRELNEYFVGMRRVFTVPLDLRGTPFQLACWNALLAIPYGETRTYADIARAVGRPQGFRAVGLANNRNPVAIIVPCHRVIASDGTLCGYGGGLDVKRKLLELEGALAVSQPPLSLRVAGD